MARITPEEALARLQGGSVSKVRAAKGVSSKPGPALTLAHTVKHNKADRLYVFNRKEDGEGEFIITPADSDLPPILGVCDESAFNKGDMPPCLQDWLGEYAREIAWYQTHGSTEDAVSDGEEDAPERQSVAALVTAKWNQSKPYNKDLDFGDGLCYVGCNAVAIGQIMYYWGLRGFHRGCLKTAAYTTSGKKYKIPALDPVSAFDYKNLTAGKPTKTAAIAAVAKLLEYIGKAIKSNYTTSGTGAYPSTCASVMKKSFRLGPNVKLIQSASLGLAKFEEKLYNELVAKRPMYMAGYNSKSGHAFVCDGYDAATGKFHFNWGWGGSYNGWFTLSALTPAKGYDYTQKKVAIIGIEPQYILGDVNKDGVVDVSDAMCVVDDVLQGKNEEIADVSSDGSVSVTDVQLIIDKILGKNVL